MHACMHYLPTHPLTPLMARTRHSEAEPLYRQVVEQRQRVVAPEHPDTITSINNLAVCIDAMGRWAGSDAAAYGWGKGCLPSMFL